MDIVDKDGEASQETDSGDHAGTHNSKENRLRRDQHDLQ